VVTPGFRYSSGMYGLASQAQRIARDRICRLIGKYAHCFPSFVTQA
jgi:hypothetical protein